MNPDNFEKPKYTFGGIYRGLVESNDDPLDAGRLKLRIFGLHDTTETTIDQLPWAEPALGLYSSGGYNINNEDYPAGSEPPKDKGIRYNPGSKSKPVEPQKPIPIDKFADQRLDDFGNACGTGGQFVVPKRGNWVFCFFEAGNHMKPIYFAMAPMARDWKTQKIQRTEEVLQKIKQIGEFKGEFSPRSSAKALDDVLNLDSWAPDTKVTSESSKPTLSIDPLTIGNKNRDMYCTTTAQGTTFIIDNRNGHEKIYIIHKNSLEYVDEDGNKKLYIGNARNISKLNSDKIPQSEDPNTPCNYEIGVEGNHEIHVLGKYKIYAKDAISIQCDGNVNLDASGDVGILSRKGNVNVLIKSGNLNADIKGNADINIQDNANIKVKKNANILVEKDLKATVLGSSDLIMTGDVKMATAGNLNLTIAGDTKIATANLDITTTNLNVSGTASFNQSVKIAQSLDVGRNLSVGQYAYVIAGINCGGTLINRGLAELGSPVILHTCAVIGGMSTGTGKAPQSPSIPNQPSIPTPALRTPPSNIISKLN